MHFFWLQPNQLVYSFPGYPTLLHYFTIFPVVFHLRGKVIWNIYICFVYIRSEKLEVVSIPPPSVLVNCIILCAGSSFGAHFLSKALFLMSSIGEKKQERVALVTLVLRKGLCASLYRLCPSEKCRVEESCPISSPDGKSMDSFLHGDVQPYHSFSCQRNMH